MSVPSAKSLWQIHMDTLTCESPYKTIKLKRDVTPLEPANRKTYVVKEIFLKLLTIKSPGLKGATARTFLCELLPL